MISYELAKQLKDAGFPQTMRKGDLCIYGSKEYLHTGGGHLEGNKRIEGFYVEVGATCCLADEDTPILLRNIYDDLIVKIPTLSDLIGAMQSRYKYIPGLINDAQFVLRKTFIGGKEGYIAYLDGSWERNENIDIEYAYRVFSPIPEEAVANLYLVLNKK